MTIRRFHLQRDEDVSGVSGTGIIAEGVQFSDGTVALHWTGDYPTTNVHERGIESVEAVHGHSGMTRVVWTDAPECPICRGAGAITTWDPAKDPDRVYQPDIVTCPRCGGRGVLGRS